MPQLDPSNFSNQITWLFITFVSCYLLVHFILIPNIKFCVFARRKHIDALLYEAQQANAMVEQIIEQMESLKAYANSQADFLLKKSQIDAVKIITECVSKLNADFITYIKEIDEEKKEQLKKVALLLPEIVVEISSNIEKIWIYKTQSNLII
ncbi:F0F1 ATP synthase subunit B family protein [Lyticum sinuosum]|uniref:ATP synthase subunit b n=1 Tax=Lyticum sinuosum TaxID=1332059 RepID=A0AAE5AHR9_9RICK|nr:hypothetical protein [Lyticum sinuosum]MDZ5761463.1 ATP synthase subunit b' [Lyticum sinuosum]